MLTTPAGSYSLRYPTTLPSVLGISGHIDWWPIVINSHQIGVIATRQLYSLLSKHVLINLDSVENTLTIRSCCAILRAYTEQEQQMVLATVESQIEATNADPFFNPLSHSERCDAMKLNDKIPTDVMAKLSMSLASLQKSLLEKDPLMPQHLRASHQLIINYPETVHLLDDVEVEAIIDASEIHTKTQIVADTVKKGAGTKKKIAATDL